jgi:hypothetical protein
MKSAALFWEIDCYEDMPVCKTWSYRDPKSLNTPKRMVYICAGFEPPPGHQVFLTGGFRGFPQSLRPNSGIVSRLGHDRFLPNPFQFTYHPTSERYSLDTRNVVTEQCGCSYGTGHEVTWRHGGVAPYIRNLALTAILREKNLIYALDRSLGGLQSGLDAKPTDSAGNRTLIPQPSRPNRGNIPAFAWRDWGKTRKASIRIAGDPRTSRIKVYSVTAMPTWWTSQA